MFSSPSLRWSGLAWPGHVYRNYIIFTVRCRILKLNTTGCYIVPYSTPQYNWSGLARPGMFFAMNCDRILFCAAMKSDSTAAGQRELNSKLVEPSSKAKNIQKFLYMQKRRFVSHMFCYVTGLGIVAAIQTWKGSLHRLC